METTLNAIRSKGPCSEGWKKLLTNLGKTAADDEPLSLITILDSNGLEDAIWCLRAVTGHDKEIRLFAVWCARQVQHLMKDHRSINALDVAERFANGDATKEALDTAGDSARDAARDVAGDAAWDAARDSAWAAAWAAAGGAAWIAASAAASAAQETKFREMLREIEAAE